MNQEEIEMNFEHSIPSKISDMFPSPHTFSIMIENLAKENEMDYVETILNYCEENDMEYDSVAKLLNQTLKDKIKIEFIEKHNLLPKIPKLKKLEKV